MRYSLSEIFERLLLFGCKVDRHIHINKRGKIDNVSRSGIMVGYDEKSTDLIVSDFEPAIF